jgi:hypothetical protein
MQAMKDGERLDSFLNRITAICFSLLIGLSTVYGSEWLHSLFTGSVIDLSAERDIFLFQICLVSFPFLVLALLGIRAKRAWALGLALTALFWGYYLIDSILRFGDGTGANIGIGLFLPFSPFVVLLPSLVLGIRIDRRS